MFKKTLYPLLAALLFCTTLPAAAVELKGWLRETPDYPQHQGLVNFFDRLKTNSQGRYTGHVSCCEEMGQQKDVIPKFKNGEVDVVLFFSSALIHDVPEMGVLNLPFIFRNPDHMMAALNGEVGREMADLLAQKGYVVLAWYDGGARSFYSRNRLLQNVSDFKDQKVRMGKSDQASLVQALGGVYTNVAFDKIPDAFKTGALDIAENDFTSYYTSEHYKTAPFYTFSYHSVQPIAMLISSQRWKTLSDADKTIFRQSAQESSAFAAKVRSQRDAELRTKLEKAGVKFTDFRGTSTAISLMKSVYAPVVVSPKATEIMVKILTSSSK